MSTLSVKPKPQTIATNSSNVSSIKTISGRQSKELIIGFCGAIGAGIKTVKRTTKKQLEQLGYEVIDIRMSQLMDRFPESAPYAKKAKESAFERYNQYQNLGDFLREKYSPQLLAEAAINEIAVNKQMKRDVNDMLQADEAKVAYLLDQLKNPAELELFRLVYPNNFYLIGVIRPEDERSRNLLEEGVEHPKISNLIQRDKKSAGNNGQNTEKTILDSDIFILNTHNHLKHLQSSIDRFIKLIHGVNGITPTSHEKGMFAAFSASLQSACLSRQVGAAITDNEGNVIALGKNDVPKPFGGLYSADDGEKDHRCIHKGGKCYNDTHKFKIKNKIKLLLEKANVENFEELTDEICSSGISSLIEFSRSIHAEMDAITSIARSGKSSTQNSILYTTTYPCHNCARHIVAAGIVKVFYIQPYEKSLALDLHDDAISSGKDSAKVIFEAFEGVSPRRYSKFFFPSAERKDSLGKAVAITTKYKHHVDIQFLDSYQDYEKRISRDYLKKLNPEG
ncbi:deaminase [Rheinheimera muenzenbergensis]|uniref:Deaminase n=1 Tax=Rheinheimera muenzenbergensis TaxID=1193628 RepID=A0ABU8C595_9GAMM